jgi:transcriptional regulator with XRE-family HTH domain
MSSNDNTVQFKAALGRLIVALRKARGWNQQELAKKIGTTSAAVSSWELGKAEPDTKHVRALAAAFDLQVADMFNFAEDHPDATSTVRPGTVAEGVAPWPASPSSIPDQRPVYERAEYHERRAFTALVDALRQLDRIDTRDPQAWRARIAWQAVVGASTIVRELAGWKDEDWKRLHDDRVDYWRKAPKWRRSEEKTAAEWMQRTFEFLERESR